MLRKTLIEGMKRADYILYHVTNEAGKTAIFEECDKNERILVFEKQRSASFKHWKQRKEYTADGLILHIYCIGIFSYYGFTPAD